MAKFDSPLEQAFALATEANRDKAGNIQIRVTENSDTDFGKNNRRVEKAALINDDFSGLYSQSNEPLSVEMVRFLQAHRAGVIRHLKANGEPLSREDSSRFYVQLEHLPVVAHAFESALGDVRKLGEKGSEMPFSDKLAEIRELIGDKFTDKLTKYYDELEDILMVIADKIEKDGVGYLMDGNNYREEFAGDLEKALDKMIEGFDKVSMEELSVMSPEYRETQALSGEEIKELYGDRYKNDPEEGEYQLEQHKIKEIDELLENDADPEEIKKRVLGLTKKTLHRMRDSVAAKTKILLGKYSENPDNDKYDGRRLIDMYQEDPLMKLEYLLGTTVRSVRSLVSINMQKGYLPAKILATQKEGVIAS
jgi:hypothetical protein